VLRCIGFGADGFDGIAELRRSEGADVLKAQRHVALGDFGRLAIKTAKHQERRTVGGGDGTVGRTARDGEPSFQKRTDRGIARGPVERLSAGAFVENDAESGIGETHEARAAACSLGASDAVIFPAGKLGVSSEDNS